MDPTFKDRFAADVDRIIKLERECERGGNYNYGSVRGMTTLAAVDGFAGPRAAKPHRASTFIYELCSIVPVVQSMKLYGENSEAMIAAINEVLATVPKNSEWVPLELFAAAF